MARPVGRRGEARARVLDSALELFCEHGVGGTSLQMIADRLGVTKAAVYHQFRAKDDIVLAVLQPVMAEISALLTTLEREPDSPERRHRLVEGLVDIVLGHRQVMSALAGDPGVGECLHGHPDLASVVNRLRAVLLGTSPGVPRLIAGAMVGGGLMSIGRDPRLADEPAEDLREELVRASRRLLDAVD